MTLAGAAFAFGLVVGCARCQDVDRSSRTTPIVTVILIAAPLAFLVGIGGFDYWGRWMIGSPTQPEDHSDHGARSWKDYFRVNTDHKVIGIQYTVTALFFMLVGGALAEVIRAELAQPGQQIVDPNTYNGLFSVHASLMIFLVIIPIFAGLANFVLPLMIGAPDMAFPRLNALSYWLLPVAGVMMIVELPGPRQRRLQHRLDGLRAVIDQRAAGPAVLHDRGAVRGHLVDHDRAQLPGHDHHHACARHDVLAHAAARVGELHDLAAGRDRDAVRRRLAVPGAARPRAARELLRRDRRAAT